MTEGRQRGTNFGACFFKTHRWMTYYKDSSLKLNWAECFYRCCFLTVIFTENKPTTHLSFRIWGGITYNQILISCYFSVNLQCCNLMVAFRANSTPVCPDKNKHRKFSGSCAHFPSPKISQTLETAWDITLHSSLLCPKQKLLFISCISVFYLNENYILNLCTKINKTKTK